jgi:uncharacterized small protein (DUF1192 family)
MQLDDKQRAAYSAYQEDLHYQASMFDSSYGDGKKDGQYQEKLNIAKNLLDVLDIETISSKTGLKREEVERLKNE